VKTISTVISLIPCSVLLLLLHALHHAKFSPKRLYALKKDNLGVSHQISSCEKRLNLISTWRTWVHKNSLLLMLSSGLLPFTATLMQPEKSPALFKGQSADSISIHSCLIFATKFFVPNRWMKLLRCLIFPFWSLAQFERV
jgi:hypothetical protein